MSEAILTIGEQDVALKRQGQSQVSTAKILGREMNGQQEVIYLDRLLHLPFAEAYGDWVAHGVISTILTKRMSA